MALYASDITGPTESTETLDLDAGTRPPRIVSIVAFVVALAIILLLVMVGGSEPAPASGRYPLQRDALTLPAVTTLRREAAPRVHPPDVFGPTVSMRSAFDAVAESVVTHT